MLSLAILHNLALIHHQPVVPVLQQSASRQPQAALQSPSFFPGASTLVADSNFWSAYSKAYTSPTNVDESPSPPVSAPPVSKAATKAGSVTSVKCPDSLYDSKYPLSKACSAQLNQQKTMRAQKRAAERAAAERAALREAEVAK